MDVDIDEEREVNEPEVKADATMSASPFATNDPDEEHIPFRRYNAMLAVLRNTLYM